MPFRAALGWLVRKDFLYSVSLPLSASFASPRCAATPLFHSVQFSRRTSSCQTPFTHTRTHAHTPQRGHLQHRPIGMALPDTAPLLVGLLLLFHAFGGEEPRHSYHSCMGYLSYMQMWFFFSCKTERNSTKMFVSKAPAVKLQFVFCGNPSEKPSKEILGSWKSCSAETLLSCRAPHIAFSSSCRDVTLHSLLLFAYITFG